MGCLALKTPQDTPFPEREVRELVLEQLMNGIALGMAYALVAVGFSMVFGVLRLINFSHGAVYAFGAYMAWVGVETLQIGLIPSVIFAIAAAGLLGIIIDKVALSPLRKKGQSGIPALITTIGVSYIIINVLTIVFGSQMRRFPTMFDWGTVSILGATVSWRQIIIALTVVALLILLSLIVNKTKAGLAMRAVEQIPLAASINGINVNRVIAFTFFLGACSAAVAGVLVASHFQFIRPTFGDVIALKAFAAAVLGGIGSLPGAALGGIIIGVAEALAVFWFGSTFIDLTAYLLMFAVLIIKPVGLLGRKGIDKV